MGYRRGFKSEANATAREIRAELGLKDLDVLDPRALAGHLLIPITPLSAYDQDAPGAVRYFTETDQGASRHAPSSTAPGALSSTTMRTCPAGRQATWLTS